MKNTQEINPHYLQPNTKSSVIHNLYFLDVETENISSRDNTIKHIFKFGWRCVVNIRNYANLKYTESWKFFSNKEEFCNDILNQCKIKKPLYLIISNPNFDLSVLGLLDFLTRKKFTLHFFHIENLSFILVAKKYVTSKTSSTNSKKRVTKVIKILGIQNWFPFSVKQIGKILGKEKIEVDFENVSYEKLKRYCKRDVEIIKDIFLEYLKFIKQNDMGTFALTRSSQAFNVFRHKFMKTNIFVHANKNVVKLERDAYFGGVCECFRIGKFTNEKFYKLDVNSMYPFVMRENYFPIELIHYGKEDITNILPSILDNFCIIANVIVETQDPMYPYRMKDRTIYPVGRFRTTLNTAMLKYAVEKNEVKKVYEYAIYKKEKIFTEFIDYFYELRRKFKKENNKIYDTICKLIMNSLYGKFGQRIEKIVENIENPSSEMYRRRYVSLDRNESGIEMQIMNRYIRVVGFNEGKDSVVSIASHTTEYARKYLFDLIKVAGRENVYYTDTDSLIVNEKGFQNLRSYVSNNELGMLKLEGVSNYLEIRNPKDYTFGMETKRKGVRIDATKIGENVYSQVQFPSLKTILHENIKDYFESRIIKKELDTEYKKGIITKEGIVIPFSLSE